MFGRFCNLFFERKITVTPDSISTVTQFRRYEAMICMSSRALDGKTPTTLIDEIAELIFY